MTFFSFQDIIMCTTGIMIMITMLLLLDLVERAEGAPSAPRALAAGNVEAEQRRAATIRRALEEAVAETARVIEERVSAPVVTAGQIRALDASVLQIRTTTDQAARAALALNVAIKVNQAAVVTIAEELRAAEKAAQESRERTKKAQRTSRVTLLAGAGARTTPIFVECEPKRVRAGRLGPDGFAVLEKTFEGDASARQFLGWALRRSAADESFVLLVRPGAAEVALTLRSTLLAQKFETGWDVWPAERNLFDAKD